MHRSIGKGQTLRAHAEDLDLIESIQALNHVGFLPRGTVTSGAIPVILAEMIRLDGYQIGRRIALIGVRVPTEITVQLIRTVATGDNVAAIAAMHQVITTSGIQDVPTGLTAQGFRLITALQHRGHHGDLLHHRQAGGVKTELLGLDVVTTGSSARHLVHQERVALAAGTHLHTARHVILNRESADIGPQPLFGEVGHLRAPGLNQGLKIVAGEEVRPDPTGRIAVGHHRVFRVGAEPGVGDAN